MPLRQNPSSVNALPARAKRILVAYRAATKRQLATAGSRFMRGGESRYPYQVPGGTTAVAHMRDRMVTALGNAETGQWYFLARKAARLATHGRFGLAGKPWPPEAGPKWPADAQAADLALQAALLVAIAEEGGATFDDDVREWLVTRWQKAGLPL